MNDSLERSNHLNKIFIISFILSILFFFIFCSFFYHYTVDDAFISYRYAENFISGEGLVYNLNQRVEGYSNLTWIFLLGLGKFSGTDPVFFSKLLGILSGLGLISLVFYFEYYKEALFPVLPLGTILCGVSIPLSAWAVGGLETVFYTLLVFGGMILLRKNNYFISTVFLGLAAVSRPEGILFSALAFVWLLAFNKEIRLRPLHLFIPLFFPFLGQLIFRVFYYGQWLPNTFGAKVGVGAGQWIKGFSYIGSYFIWSEWFSVFWSLLPWGIYLLWKQRRDIAVLWTGAIGLQFIFILVAGGDWMKPYRFMTPVMPILFCFLSLAANQIYLTLKKKRISYGYVFLIVLAGLLVGSTYLNWRKTYAYTRIYSTGLEKTSISIGKWLAERSEPTEWIALGDVGALPYYSQLQVIDLYGLVNPDIARLPGPALYSEGIDIQKILEKKPRFIALEFKVNHRGRVQGGLKPVDRKMFLEPRFQKEYVAVQEALFSPRELTVLYERKDRRKSERKRDE
jgi:arabinofuranosyltransferase